MRLARPENSDVIRLASVGDNYGVGATMHWLPIPNMEVASSGTLWRSKRCSTTGMYMIYSPRLKNVSNAFVGYLSPLILNKEIGGVYGELLTTIQRAGSVGLPDNWFPICEDSGDYYCVAPDCRVRFWSHGSVG